MISVVKNKESGWRSLKIIASNSILKLLVLQKWLIEVNIRMD